MTTQTVINVALLISLIALAVVALETKSHTFNVDERLQLYELREQERNERRAKIMTAIEMEILEALEDID